MACAQQVYDPFREVCIKNTSLPVDESGPVPFYNMIHSAGQIISGSVKYAFDGRPDSAGNSFFDYYVRPVPLLMNGVPRKRPVVLILHGGDGERGQPSLVKQGKDWARRGYLAIVPDYRAGRDAIYGNTTCRDSIQLALAVQHSVVDIRGVVRKVISMARTSQQVASLADTTAFFIVGNSWGSGTAYNLAVSDAHEWKLNGQTVTGVQYLVADNSTQVLSVLDFYDNLDALPVNGTCTVLDKRVIKGLSLSAMPSIHIGMIDPGDTIPMVFFHGTCDPLAIYNKINSRQLLINNVNAQLASQGLPIPSVPVGPLYPCDAPQFSYTFYGPQAILDYVRDVLPPQGSIPFMTRLFRVCGGQHTIDTEAFEMEKVIFFKDILDGTTERSEIFTLDVTLLYPVNADLTGTKEFFNCLFQKQSNTWPEGDQLCKNCGGYPTKLNRQSRCPYLDLDEPVDGENRYRAKPSTYCSDLVSSAGIQEYSTVQEQVAIERIEVYDLSGRLIAMIRAQTNVPGWDVRAVQDAGLSPGVYLLKASRQVRKVGVFR